MAITRRKFMPLAAAMLAALSARVAEAQQSLPLVGIAYAAIRVRNLAASKAFYQSLGFEEQPADAAGSVLKVNDHQYVRLIAPAPAATNGTKNSAAFGFYGLGFEATDLAALHEEYASHGLKPTGIAQDSGADLSFTIDGPAQTQAGSVQGVPQVIEYLQYAPDSRLGAGFGQHLGADRIGDRLLAAAVPCLNPDDAREFYLNDLSFKPLPGSPMLLHLPGSSGQYVSITPGGERGSQARLIFETSGLGRAERHLRREHIAFSRAATNKDGGLEVFSFMDPDGNTLLVQQR